MVLLLALCTFRLRRFKCLVVNHVLGFFPWITRLIFSFHRSIDTRIILRRDSFIFTIFIWLTLVWKLLGVVRCFSLVMIWSWLKATPVLITIIITATVVILMAFFHRLTITITLRHLQIHDGWATLTRSDWWLRITCYRLLSVAGVLIVIRLNWH